MADITMCSGNNCPIKEDCYRYTALANPYWQSFFTTAPFNESTNQCSEFYLRKDQRPHKTVKIEKSS